ncbi:MAG: class I SAM-dependent methyltransferase [Miltoncostaeaceae bacterium]
MTRRATHARGHDAGHFGSPAAVRRLEDEERALAGVVDEAVAALAALADGRPVRRLLDLGCGPGGALAALGDAFPGAALVAADASPAMLARVAARAAEAGIGSRVYTRRVDLDGDLDALGRCDLVWAAMSLHHARDPGATLVAARRLLEPSGLLCLLERAPAEGHPGGRQGDHGEVGPDLVAAAGLDVVTDRTLGVGDAATARRLIIGVAAG